MGIELIFGGIIKLLGSAGFGTIFGGIMGYFNRKADLEVKKLDLQAAADQRSHELAMRDKDAAIMAQEWAARTKVAEIEGATASEQAGYAALAKSYEFAKPAPGSRMEAFSSFVRPFVSLAYFIVTSIGGAWIVYYAFKVKGVEFTQAQWYDLVMFVLAWVAFMAGSTIGWWFAMRPSGKTPVLALQR